jgi:CDP-glycerol glycerophosphotransferase (TagB/SpsB family)
MVDKNNYDPLFYYQMYPELSRTGRLHFHGFIKVNDILNFYLKVVHGKLNAKFGGKPQYIFEIDTIGNGIDENSPAELLKWYKYCTKQQPLWKAKFENPTMIKNKLLFEPAQQASSQ